MAEAVYILCALTSIACAVMLVRGYRRSKARLLFWSAACFACFALNNILLFVDLVLLPTEIDLMMLRNGINLAGLLLLLFGMIWETSER